MRLALLALSVVLGLALGWLLLGGGAPDEGVAPRPAGAVLARGPEPPIVATAPGSGRSDVGPGGADTGPSAETPAGDDPPEFPPEEEEDLPSRAELLERLGLAPNAPCALGLERLDLPDPLEPGDAMLELTLVDARSGRPFQSEVVLWRLDAPANTYWTAGDQDVARAVVGDGGYSFEGLPAGEYRAVVLEERARAPHQPAFFVSGRTAVTLFIERPGERPVRLALAGREPPLPRVEAAFHPITSQASGLVPYWVRRRDLQPVFDILVDFEFSDGDPWFPYDLEWLPLRATPAGLDLGTFREDARCRSYHQRVDLRCDEGWEATVELQNAPSGEVLTMTLDPDDDGSG